MPPGTTLIFDRYLGDLRVHIDTRFKIERIMWTGELEPALQRLIRDRIPDGAVCLDVGANVGAVTLGLAKAVGTTGRVFALEPAPPNFARLQDNIRLNPHLAERITPLNVGAGAKAETLYWTEEPGNPGNGSLSPAGTIAVPVTTIDEVTTRHGLTRLDFIKLDVEGMEWPVFLGAQQSLRRFTPMLYFESLGQFASAGGHGNFSRIEELVRAAGYRLYRIGRGARLTEISDGKFSDYTVAIHGEQTTAQSMARG